MMAAAQPNLSQIIDVSFFSDCTKFFNLSTAYDGIQENFDKKL